MKWLILLTGLFAASVFAQVPDPTMTPGVANPDVAQDNIKTTICKSGWTATIRPPASYTTALKKRQIPMYGYADTNPASYEEDHFISLEIGGHPSDPHNLWPQPYAGSCGARVKDKVETRLKKLICNGTITLAEAQTAITDDWTAAYQKYVNPKGCK